MNITFKQCIECGNAIDTNKNHCKHCYSTELKMIEIDGKGIVYSFTKIYSSPPQFAEDVPYYVILVELERGLKLTGRIKGDQVQINQTVHFDKIINGCYYFNIDAIKDAK